jgi:tyrosine-protein phosphatase-like protein OCA2
MYANSCHLFLVGWPLITPRYLGDRSEEDNEEYFKWAESHGIRLVSFYVESVKEPFIRNNSEAVLGAMNIILDSRNYPILVHSNKGKHRVGTLVGVMRKMLQGYDFSCMTNYVLLYFVWLTVRWSLAAIFDEYGRFAGGKGDADVEVSCSLINSLSWPFSQNWRRLKAY